jgi:hypothetical protein
MADRNFEEAIPIDAASEPLDISTISVSESGTACGDSQAKIGIARHQRGLAAFLYRPHEAVRFKIVKAGTQFGLTFAGLNIILVLQLPAKRIDLLRFGEKAPDVGSNRIEPEAVAIVDIERDQFLTNFGFEQFPGPDVSNDHFAMIALILR